MRLCDRSALFVRAGAKARYADDFRNGSFIAMGFEDFFPGDLEAVTDQALGAWASNPAQRTFASQLAGFAYHLDVGDYVIVPLLPKERSYLVGSFTV
jgi:predicted Mrr-cat superfamily restriction endonuclease